MNQPHEDDVLAQQAKALFDDSVDRLDGASLSRLNRDRHAALAELQSSRLRGRWSMWAPVTGVAAAALVAVIVLRSSPDIGLETQTETVADFEILMEGEDLELIEDLEFYSWLASSELGTSSDVG
ncbi:MAG: hypothetical protein AAF351_01475 [Pseudomonadota bacterium]